ncbi:MAG TPA: hypothetical protein VF985_07465 [Mariniflexile sp.]
MTWTPDFIEVANSGDLGYTYGTYHYTYKDALGEDQVDTGISIPFGNVNPMGLGNLYGIKTKKVQL